MSYITTSINHNLTEEELIEVAEALFAVKKAQGWSNQDAKVFAQDVTQGVFRNLVSIDSIKQWLVRQANGVERRFQ